MPPSTDPLRTVLSHLFVLVPWMFVSGIFGYLFGSFPTAYVFVRWARQRDIRKEGSGNIGVLNTFVVTRSKSLAAAVLLVDLVKGALPILILEAYIAHGFIFLAAAGIGAVLGHTFPVWLQFKGGRGLAVAAGAMLMFSWQTVVVWLFLWGIGYLVLRHVNLANAVASLVSLLTIVALPARILRTLVGPESTMLFRYFSVLIFGIILVKHLEPVQTYFKERKSGKKEKEEEPAHAGS